MLNPPSFLPYNILNLAGGVLTVTPGEGEANTTEAVGVGNLTLQLQSGEPPPQFEIRSIDALGNVLPLNCAQYQVSTSYSVSLQLNSF